MTLRSYQVIKSPSRRSAIQATDIPFLHSVKYLEIILVTKITFKQQILQPTSKCSRALYLSFYALSIWVIRTSPCIVVLNVL